MEINNFKRKGLFHYTNKTLFLRILALSKCIFIFESTQTKKHRNREDIHYIIFYTRLEFIMEDNIFTIEIRRNLKKLKG